MILNLPSQHARACSCGAAGRRRRSAAKAVVVVVVVVVAVAMAVAVALSASLLFATHASAADAKPPASSLVGTWTITTTPPAPNIPSHLAFTTVDSGGGLVSSPIIYLPPPFTSMGTAHGSWKKTGPVTYATTFVAFGYDSAGKPAGIIKVNATHRLTGNGALEGRSQLFICDLKLACEPPLPGYATIMGTRLPVEAVAAP